ncbi:MAG TPA: TonB-dependent receptor, partial [Acinetobacter nosocomialis]|nr:TonB-dependent receptor [Acinetobacter nosocomialis]
MQLKTQLFVLSLLSLSIQQVMAADDTNTKEEKPAELATITVKAEPTAPANNTSLAEGATSIGNALKGQAGVYSAQYTGGASRPVIRGQDGTRVKIVQNGGDVMDVSSVSPDHAVTVDPNSAQDIQILNGAEALLYGAGSVGGLVNVVDEKIPTSMPDKGYQGKAGVRYNSGSDELLYSGQATVGLGDHVALRVGGLKRDANDYILPRDLQTDERRQDSTFADSKNYNAGLSWIGDRGFIGASFSQRHDQYGIPADNELFGSCERDGLHLVCGTDDPSTDHEHEHEHDASWINLKEKRYDLKGELRDPFAGFAKVAAQASYTDYQHEEMHNTDVGTTFKSKGIDSRVTLENNAWAGWTGQIGAQYTQQKLNIVGDESIMDPSKTQRYSVFGLQQKQINNVNLAVSSRIDHQTIDIESDQKNYTGTGYSVAGTASWEFIPQYKLSLTTSQI